MSKMDFTPPPSAPISPDDMPPVLCQLLLEWVLPHHLQEPILGDLQQEFSERRRQHAAQARWWYRRQTYATCWHFIQQTQGEWLMFLLSVVFFIGVSVWTMLLSAQGHDSSMFVDLPSLALVVVPAVLFATGSCSQQIFKQTLAVLLGSRRLRQAHEYQQCQHWLNVCGQSALLMGIFGTLIGLIAVANQINAENFAYAIGPSLGVALITLLYGYAVKVLCYVGAQRIDYLAAQAQQQEDI